MGDEREILVFDVNETLLDLAGLDQFFTEHFGNAGVRKAWFRELLHQAFLSTIIESYQPFGLLAGIALRIVGQYQQVTVPDDAVRQLGQAMINLQAHPDVRPALQSLRNAGFRLATLTNSTEVVGNAQVTNAGLIDLFEMTLSADSVHRLKPAPEPYWMTAAEMDVPIDRMRMVAAHGWDIAGALKAGCRASFIARPGQFMTPRGPQPDHSVRTITELADVLTAPVR